MFNTNYSQNKQFPLCGMTLLKSNIYTYIGRSMRLGNGKSIDFWLDTWCGKVFLIPWRISFLICTKYVLFSKWSIYKELEIEVRRWLNEDLPSLDNFITFCLDTKSMMTLMLLFGIGRVKLVYKYLCRNSYDFYNKQMWKAKMPLKIKIFMWLTLQNSILN
jgi:hypothetical protein